MLLFIAGHGVNDGPSYRFLATNAERVGDGFRGATVVPWQVLQEAVERAKGRRMLFIDTCHSGNAYNQTLGNAAYHANIIAYTSARFDQEALEDHHPRPRPLHLRGGGGPGRQGSDGGQARGFDQGAGRLRHQAGRRAGQSHEWRAGAAILQGPGCRGLRLGSLIPIATTSARRLCPPSADVFQTFVHTA